jgi:hypothetical protein
MEAEERWTFLEHSWVSSCNLPLLLREFLKGQASTYPGNSNLLLNRRRMALTFLRMTLTRQCYVTGPCILCIHFGLIEPDNYRQAFVLSMTSLIRISLVGVVTLFQVIWFETTKNRHMSPGCRMWHIFLVHFTHLQRTTYMWVILIERFSL